MQSQIIKLPRPVRGKEFIAAISAKPMGGICIFMAMPRSTFALLPEDKGEVAKGGELRWHPFRQEWNLYAPHRQNRTFKPSAADDPLAPSKPGGAATEIPFTDFELAVFENKFTSCIKMRRATSKPADENGKSNGAVRCGRLWPRGHRKSRIYRAG